MWNVSISGHRSRTAPMVSLTVCGAFQLMASENEMRYTFTPTSCHLSTMSSIIPSRRSRSKGPSKLDPNGLPSVMEADSTSDQPHRGVHAGDLLGLRAVVAPMSTDIGGQ